MKPVLPCLQISSSGTDSLYLKLVPSDNTPSSLPKRRAEIVKHVPFVPNSPFLRLFMPLIINLTKSVSRVHPPCGFRMRREAN